MTSFDFLLLLIFAVATLVGYKLIQKVPSLLHTPLMSGMNAFSGVTLLACLVTMSYPQLHLLSAIFGCLAIILASINLVGGFAVTDRMLKMFHPKRDQKED